MYPDLRLGDLANAVQRRIAQAKATALAADAQAFVSAAASLDADADAAVARGDAVRAAADQARLRKAEAAFFNVNAKTWNRSLLYGTGRGADVLPSLEKDPQSIDAALRAASAAASTESK
jgi:hypothetical protein